MCRRGLDREEPYIELGSTTLQEREKVTKNMPYQSRENLNQHNQSEWGHKFVKAGH